MVKDAEIAGYALVGEDCKLVGCCIEGVLGDRVTVWRWAHVMADAYVGDDSMIAQCAFVHSGAEIGKECRIMNGAAVSDGAVIGDRVYVGPNVVFANSRRPHHDPAKRVHETIVVGDDAVIGSNAVILGGVTIGAGATVGALSVVSHDVPEGATVKGAPAR